MNSRGQNNPASTLHTFEWSYSSECDQEVYWNCDFLLGVFIVSDLNCMYHIYMPIDRLIYVLIVQISFVTCIKKVGKPPTRHLTIPPQHLLTNFIKTNHLYYEVDMLCIYIWLVYSYLMGGLWYRITAQDTTSGRGSFPVEHSRRFGGGTVSIHCDSVIIRQRDVTNIARFSSRDTWMKRSSMESDLTNDHFQRLSQST